MDRRDITDRYSVAPQIEISDIAALAEDGFTTIIDNRPDAEIPPELQSDEMAKVAEAAGIRFVYNPVVNGGLTEDMVTAQGAEIGAEDGRILAYCRSGTRSTIVWALSQAGTRPADDLISDAARAGYDIAGLKPQIEALAKD